MNSEELKPVYHSLYLLLATLVVGVSGYYFIESYPLLDAFFMTIITVTTVGFQEVHPLSAAGKIFTSFLIVFSFGIFAYSATTLARYIISGVFRNYYKYKKVKKEIDKLSNHVIIVGYGRNGFQAVKELLDHKIPVVVIENRESKVKEIQQNPKLLYIADDPSSDEVLLGAGLLRAKALICVLPTDEENLFVVLTSHELNPKLTIISRAINFNTIKKLKIAGASNVLMPDKISGQHMAKMVAQPEVIEFIDYLMLDKSDDVILGEILCPEIKNNGDITLGLYSTFCNGKLNFIGIKHPDGKYQICPSETSKIETGDLIFALGTHPDIELLKRNLLHHI